MIVIIIEIDGFYHQVLLTGQKHSKKELKQMYIQAKELTFKTIDFPSVFCRLYNFQQIPYSKDIEADFVLDTDTDRVYSPSY